MILFWLNRILALAVWGTLVVQAYFESGGADAYLRGLVFFFPLAVIWLGDALGDAEGFSVFFRPAPGVRRYRLEDFILGLFGFRKDVDNPSSGFLVKLVGWVILTGPWWFSFLAST